MQKVNSKHNKMTEYFLAAAFPLAGMHYFAKRSPPETTIYLPVLKKGGTFMKKSRDGHQPFFK